MIDYIEKKRQRGGLLLRLSHGWLYFLCSLASRCYSCCHLHHCGPNEYGKFSPRVYTRRSNYQKYPGREHSGAGPLKPKAGKTSNPQNQPETARNAPLFRPISGRSGLTCSRINPSPCESLVAIRCVRIGLLGDTCARTSSTITSFPTCLAGII